jgi:hypothetical protein
LIEEDPKAVVAILVWIGLVEDAFWPKTATTAFGL